MPLLTTSDAEWLRENYPALEPNEGFTQVRGELSFTAAYDADSGLFTLARPNVQLSGVVLSGRHRILIKDICEANEERRRLPRLFIKVENISFSPERHFNVDNSACLHGPSEEVAFVAEGYSFLKFLEQLCLPFLYGQLYYDLYRRWPWPSYEHGTIGAIESYGASGGPQSLAFSLAGYLKDRPAWPAIRAILVNKRRPKGHMRCLCGSGKPIRSCHSGAWEGLKKLHKDVQTCGGKDSSSRLSRNE